MVVAVWKPRLGNRSERNRRTVVRIRQGTRTFAGNPTVPTRSASQSVCGNGPRKEATECAGMVQIIYLSVASDQSERLNTMIMGIIEADDVI